MDIYLSLLRIIDFSILIYNSRSQTLRSSHLLSNILAFFEKITGDLDSINSSLYVEK